MDISNGKYIEYKDRTLRMFQCLVWDGTGKGAENAQLNSLDANL